MPDVKGRKRKVFSLPVSGCSLVFRQRVLKKEACSSRLLFH